MTPTSSSHSTPYTLHSSHSTPYTLHPTLFSLSHTLPLAEQVMDASDVQLFQDGKVSLSLSPPLSPPLSPSLSLSLPLSPSLSLPSNVLSCSLLALNPEL